MSVAGVAAVVDVLVRVHVPALAAPVPVRVGDGRLLAVGF